MHSVHVAIYDYTNELVIVVLNYNYELIAKYLYILCIISFAVTASPKLLPLSNTNCAWQWNTQAGMEAKSEKIAMRFRRAESESTTVLFRLITACICMCML